MDAQAAQAQRVYLQLERALRAGDLGQLPTEISAAADFPNAPDPYTHTPLLALAISWAPVITVGQLLAAGADPNFEALDGFPALVGAVMSGRDDRSSLLQVLVDAGAELDRQGINGWTALHAAASLNDEPSARVLLTSGANPVARTGVDLDETPLDEANRAGSARVAELLRAAGN